MKAITRLHPRKTQHHVHNCLHLISCCGVKWCIMSTYTSTFNNNIWHALQRVGHLLNGWTLLSWFLANSPEKLDTACQAFPLIHCRSFFRWCWAFNLHWVNWVCRGFTLRVKKSFSISGVPRPFAAFLWYFTTRAECIFSRCNCAFKHNFHELNIWQMFIFKG